MKLALLAHWDEFRKGWTHCGLFVLTQAFDCYTKGGKKVAEVPPSSPLPPRLARHRPFNRASCPGSEKGLGVRRAGRWAQLQGSG